MKLVNEKFSCFLLRHVPSYMYPVIINLIIFDPPFTEAYSEFCQTSKVELFAKIINFSAVNYFPKNLHLRCLKGSKYAPDSKQIQRRLINFHRYFEYHFCRFEKYFCQFSFSFRLHHQNLSTCFQLYAARMSTRNVSW